MSQSARSMLQSRAFGSSDEEDEQPEQSGADSLINNETMAGTSYANDDASAYEYASRRDGTAANLASFEDSFVPAEPPPAPLGNNPRPKTPAHKPRTASQATVRDAAGFVKQGAANVGQPFARDDATADMSRVTAANETENRTAADMTDLTGRDDEHEPNFERSESQSVRAPPANVNTARGKASAPARAPGSGAKQQLTLREQEKVIDEVKKENFSLKLKIYFLEERLSKLAPDQVDLALKENIEMKVEFQTVRQELKKHKKLLLEATKTLEDSQRNQLQANGRHSRSGMEAQAEIQRLRDALQAEQDKNAQAERDKARLNDRLREASTSRAADNETLEREVDELEKENAKLRAQVNAQVTMLSTRNDEKDQLYDEIEALKQDVLALEAELTSTHGRRGSDASHGSEAIRELEDELNSYRDKLSAAMLDLEKRDTEVQELNAELDQQDADHAKALKEWKTALEEARQDKDALTDAVEERDQEIRELEAKLDELDALAQDDRTRIEDAVKVAEKKEKEVNDLGEEVIGLTEDLEKLGKQIEDLQDEVDAKNVKIEDLERELDAADKELEDKQRLHEQVVVALKEKVSTSKARHTEMTIQRESLSTEVAFLRTKVEELAVKSAELEEGKRTDEKLRRRLENDKHDLERRLRDKEIELEDARLEARRELSEAESSWRNTVSEKDQLLAAVRTELKSAKDRLQVREQDLARMNSALQDREQQVKKAGDDHTSDRLSLVLEVERLSRDLAHYEADLDHAKSDLEKKEEELRQRSMEAATLRATNNDISAQLALQTQTRLGLSDKLDEATKSLREVQDEMQGWKERARTHERDSTQNSRTASRSNANYRDQLAERNTLLQNVYQTIDRIVGTDKRKPHQADMKPHSNFTAFHDSLQSRLRTIAQIQQLFDKRAKEIDGHLTEQNSTLRKQFEAQSRQLNRMETTVKAATDSQKQWKQRVLLKQSEIDAVKATNSELNQQVSSLKARVNTSDMSPGSTHKIQTLSARASNAEKRLKATQDQLALVEQKFSEAKNKTGDAEEQWEARLRELMVKLREAQEKNKRERQGAKERVRELQQTIDHLQHQVSETNARSSRLSNVLTQQGF